MLKLADIVTVAAPIATLRLDLLVLPIAQRLAERRRWRVPGPNYGKPRYKSKDEAYERWATHAADVVTAAIGLIAFCLLLFTGQIPSAYGITTADVIASALATGGWFLVAVDSACSLFMRFRYGTMWWNRPVVLVARAAYDAATGQRKWKDKYRPLSVRELHQRRASIGIGTFSCVAVLAYLLVALATGAGVDAAVALSALFYRDAHTEGLFYARRDQVASCLAERPVATLRSNQKAWLQRQSANHDAVFDLGYDCSSPSLFYPDTEGRCRRRFSGRSYFIVKRRHVEAACYRLATEMTPDGAGPLGRRIYVWVRPGRTAPNSDPIVVEGAPWAGGSKAEQASESLESLTRTFLMALADGNTADVCSVVTEQWGASSSDERREAPRACPNRVYPLLVKVSDSARPRLRDIAVNGSMTTAIDARTAVVTAVQPASPNFTLKIVVSKTADGWRIAGFER